MKIVHVIYLILVSIPLFIIMYSIIEVADFIKIVIKTINKLIGVY